MAAKLKRLIELIVFFVFAFGSGKLVAFAQEWEIPVNLSRSGSASHTELIVSPDGRIQAFWHDDFDGMVTSVYDVESWSEPSVVQLTSFPGVSAVYQDLPNIYLAPDETIHFLWLEGNAAGSLYHASMPLGANLPSAGEWLTENAIAYDLAFDADGTVVLAFIRSAHTPEFPAGVYVMTGDGTFWNVPVLVKSSLYFRTLQSTDAHIDVSFAKLSENASALLLTWDEPRFKRSMYTYSLDGGNSWASPDAISGESETGREVYFVTSPSTGEVLRIWQRENWAGCSWVEQNLEVTQNQENEDGIAYAMIWSQPQTVLEPDSECVTTPRFWTVEKNKYLVGIWGIGSETLVVGVRTAEDPSWSVLPPLNINFEEQDTGRVVRLGQLKAVPASEGILIAGWDQEGGDIWTVKGTPNSWSEVFQTPGSAKEDLWAPPMIIESYDTSDALLGNDIVVDSNDIAHLVWVVRDSDAQSSLYYLNRQLSFLSADNQLFYIPILIYQGAPETYLDHPDLMYLNDGEGGGLLHLVWCDGESGELLYSRADMEQAATYGGWSPPVRLAQENSVANPAKDPQLGSDLLGRLYVLYVVPINEGRGVYLIKSSDGGNSWDAPLRLYDAVSEGWPKVSDPALTVSPDGKLIAAWVQRSLADDKPLGLYIARSADGGETWSNPVKIAEEGFEFPSLVLLNGMLHLFYYRMDDGTVWHRWAVLDELFVSGDTGWSIASRISGWSDVELPYVIAPVGAAMALPEGEGYLNALAFASGRGVLHSVWDGTRWNAEPLLNVHPLVDDVLLTASSMEDVAHVTSLVVGAPAGGKTLAAFWWQEKAADTTQNQAEKGALLLSWREIPAVTLPAIEPPSTPVGDALVLETNTPTPDLPTPTPTLIRQPLPANDAQLPLVLGAGTAVLMVGLLIVSWVLIRNRSSR